MADSVPVTAYGVNPTPSTWEMLGLGTYLSRMYCNQRLTMALAGDDRGRIVYDRDRNVYLLWNGLCWTDFSSSEIDVRDYGAIGDGNSNDTQALLNAIVAATQSGIRVIVFPSGYTFRLNTTGDPSAQYLVNVPDGIVFRIDGTLTSDFNLSVTFDCQGDFQAFGTGLIQMSKGINFRTFWIGSGKLCSFTGLRWAGKSTTDGPVSICVKDTNGLSIERIVITNNVVEPFLDAFFFREQSNSSTHSVKKTIIQGNTIRGIYAHGTGGVAITLNSVAGLDRDILIANNEIDGAYDDAGNVYCGEGIAVAGYGTLPLDPTLASSRIKISNNKIRHVREGIHVEYCYQVDVTLNKIEDIDAAYFPPLGQSAGISSFGSYDVNIEANTVSGVAGDNIYSWGILVFGGFYGGAYQQSNRNINVSGNRLRKASYYIEHQVQSVAIGGLQPYELNPSSILNFENNSSDNGGAMIFTVATANIRNNTLVCPLSVGPFTVQSYARNANVATLIVGLQNGQMQIRVGDTINVSGVGAAAFNTQFAVVTAVSYPSGTTGSISYANVGANVATTASGGSVYNYLPALRVDCQDTYTGNASYKSDYRLELSIEGNRAADVYGLSSFALFNMLGSRLPANLNLNMTGNNFGYDADAAGVYGVTAINRSFYTSQGIVPWGVECVVGDQVSVNIGGGVAHKNYITTARGYTGPLGDTYAIVVAANGTIKRTGATSWVTYPAVYTVGEPILLINGGNSIVGRCQKIELTGGNEVMTLVDPATGGTLDLTAVGGPGSISPYLVAIFVLF